MYPTSYQNSLYFAFFYYNKEGLGVSGRVIPSKGVIPLIIILLCVFGTFVGTG